MIRLKPPQLRVFLNPKRFRVLVAGRRFGKTYLAHAELLRAAQRKGTAAWYVAPTYKQAKRVTWDALKRMTRPFWSGRPNESDLRIQLQSGGTIAVRGADAYDSLRGEGLDFIVMDEFASMAPAAWHSVLRPMLADRKGGALFIGTPRGYNHFYDLYSDTAGQPDWAAFQFTTEEGGNVDPEELSSAQRLMDERLYRQEFRASFEQLSAGRAYWAFERTKDVRKVEFDARFDLIWSLDFNIDPASSILAQIRGDHVYVLEEISLRNSPTPMVCEEFLRRAEKYRNQLARFAGPLKVRVYGDATADSRKSSASATDWELVAQMFKDNRHLLFPLWDVPSKNPEVKDRINCVNAIILNAKGERRLHIDPRCSELIRDLERVTRKTDTHGNETGGLDDSDPMRTHMSDALGYMIARKFNMRAPIGERSKPLY